MFIYLWAVFLCSCDDYSYFALLPPPSPVSSTSAGYHVILFLLVLLFTPHTFIDLCEQGPREERIHTGITHSSPCFPPPPLRTAYGMRTHGAVVGRRFRSVTKLTTKIRIGKGYLWGRFLIAAAALKTPTRNGYNAQGANLKFHLGKRRLRGKAGR